MRELKFRAWHKGYPKRRGIDFSAIMLYPEKASDVFSWKDQGQPIEIMQFTGLKDNNGVEIYEGDLLQIAGDNFNPERSGHEVVFDTQTIDMDEWGLPNNVTGFLVKFKDGSGYCNIPDECLVIGNIYEHPHILQP